MGCDFELFRCLCFAIPSCLLLVLALGFLISDWRFSFLDCKSKFLDRILIFVQIKSRVWVLIKYYSSLVVSCFLFRFLFLLCVWISVSNLVRPQCKKKKMFTRSLPHRNVTLNKPSLQKKKNCSKKNQFRCVLYYSCLFRIEYSFLASRLCYVFVIVLN